MATNYATSAALLFTEQELGGPCVENESYPTANATPTVIAQGNGDRVGLTIVNLGNQNVYVGLTGIPNNNNAILLIASGGSLSINVRDDFTLPARQWTAFCQVMASQLYVLEIIRFTNNTLAGS